MAKSKYEKEYVVSSVISADFATLKYYRSKNS